MPTPSEILREAVALFTKGALDKAVTMAASVPTGTPEYPRALNLIGAAFIYGGRPKDAIDILKEATKLSPNDTNILNNLGLALHRTGHLQEAADVLSAALDIKEDDPQILNSLGVLLTDLGQWADAITVLEKAVEIDPIRARTRMNLAEAYFKGGQETQSLRAYISVLQMDQENTDALLGLARVLFTLKEYQQAYDLLTSATALNPSFLPAWLLMGDISRTMRNNTQALDAYRKAAAIAPAHAEAQASLGGILSELQMYDEAVHYLQSAYEMNTSDRTVARQYASALAHTARFTEADAVVSRFIDEQPEDAEMLFALGAIYRLQNRTLDAIETVQKSLSLDQIQPERQLFLAECYLMLGDFARGFDAFEWRTKLPDARKHLPNLIANRWMGEPLNGRTLYVYAEPGFSNTILFSRYVKLLADRGETVIFKVQTELLELLTVSLQGVTVIPAEATETGLPFDVHTPLLSLPYLLKETLESIPYSSGYLSPQPENSKRWLSALPDCSCRIGIAWRGLSTSRCDYARSLPFTLVKEIASIPGVTLCLLQPDVTEEELDDLQSCGAVIDVASGFESFADTAAVLSHLDMTLSVDTALLHIAGATGASALLMLPYAGDWRWQLNSSDTAWYKSVHILRQTTPGDWCGVMEKVHEIVRNHSGCKLN